MRALPGGCCFNDGMTFMALDKTDNDITSRQKIFSDSGIKLFKKPKNCHNKKLAEQLAVFNRSKE